MNNTNSSSGGVLYSTGIQPAATVVATSGHQPLLTLMKDPNHHHISSSHHNSDKGVVVVVDDSSSRSNNSRSTDDYKQKREKNNIAVRKSREKAKRRLKLNEIRINELMSENQQLKNRVEVMARVVGGLRLLLTTFGYSESRIDTKVTEEFTN
ncbi:CCAAT/enhancer-binding protein gamma-like [Oppia nitens]|uniref:CCAAT/enhancer-binding protein gamma-like n=1 Tax=Oppia nitens TaxID=1686743 RepID=UPI0023DC796F|nr:CCAAT/enhancer-binding protein gamma-like [Oppia nitens]